MWQKLALYEHGYCLHAPVLHDKLLQGLRQSSKSLIPVCIVPLLRVCIDRWKCYWCMNEASSMSFKVSSGGLLNIE